MKLYGVLLLAAMGAPAMAATSNADMYGNLNMALMAHNHAGLGTEVVSADSYLGVKGTEALGHGLNVLWQVEYGVDPVASPGGQDLVSRDTFLAINSPAYGTLAVGNLENGLAKAYHRFDAFYHSPVNLDKTGAVSGSVLDNRDNGGLSYTSPVVSGVQVAVNAGYAATGRSVTDAVSTTVSYRNGALDVAAAVARDRGMNDSTTYVGTVGYGLGDVHAGLMYEHSKGIQGNGNSLHANVSYTLGALELKAQHGVSDVTAQEKTVTTLGADYTLSKRTLAYTAFNRVETAGAGHVSNYGVGLRHVF